jgi:hypothetical protein
MRLDQALSKIGVRVLKADSSSKRLVLHLRVLTEKPRASARWNQAASGLVLAAEKNKAVGAWGAEVSKVLFAQGTAVRFVWRVVFTGKIQAAQRVLAEAALAALREGVEVTSMPLVGNKRPVIDPSRGKFKGGHDVGTAEQVVAHAMTPGVG